MKMTGFTLLYVQYNCILYMSSYVLLMKILKKSFKYSKFPFPDKSRLLLNSWYALLLDCFGQKQQMPLDLKGHKGSESIGFTPVF